MDTLDQKPRLQLVPMSQLALAVDKGDDWTGLTDAAARRKRQNRLNVRAYRRRKAQGRQPVGSSSAAPQAPITTGSQLQQAWWNEDKQMTVFVSPSFAEAFHSTMKPIIPNNVYKLHSEKRATGILFPLSSDHLITLIQYNVLRACLTNLKLLDLMHTTRTQEECGSAVVYILTDPTPESPSGKPVIPPQLQPTKIQQTVEHQAWIDIIPCPAWRDNLILAQGTYDPDDICNDVAGGLWDEAPGPDAAERGIIAWSPPWDIGGWEASEGFLKKWGWLLRGCGDVIEATNRWRRIRGEEDLAIELE